jgi:hypothetical protein
MGVVSLRFSIRESEPVLRMRVETGAEAEVDSTLIVAVSKVTRSGS